MTVRPTQNRILDPSGDVWTNSTVTLWLKNAHSANIGNKANIEFRWQIISLGRHEPNSEIPTWHWRSGRWFNSIKSFIQILRQYLASVLRIYIRPSLDHSCASVVPINHVSRPVRGDRSPAQQQLEKSGSFKAFAELTKRITEFLDPYAKRWHRHVRSSCGSKENRNFIIRKTQTPVACVVYRNVTCQNGNEKELHGISFFLVEEAKYPARDQGLRYF